MNNKKTLREVSSELDKAWRLEQQLYLKDLDTKKDATTNNETHINRPPQIINVCGMTFVLPGEKK